MAYGVVRSLSREIEPKGRKYAIIDVSNMKRVQITLWLGFRLAILLSFIINPLIPITAFITYWRSWNYSWKLSFRIALGVIAGLIVAYGAFMIPNALWENIKGYSDGINGYMHAFTANLLWNTVGAIALGVWFGYFRALWMYQLTPFYARPNKKPTFVARFFAWYDAKRIGNNEYGGDNMIVYGIEQGYNTQNVAVMQSIFSLLHTVILGRTGTGKTQTIMRIVQSYISNNYFTLYLDMKGSIITEVILARMAEAMGVPFYVFTLNAGHKWDALRGKSAQEQKDIIMSIEKWDQSHFKGIAEGVLLDVFHALEVGGLGANMSYMRAAYDMLDPNLLRKYANERLKDPAYTDIRNAVLVRAAEIERNPEAISGIRAKLYRLVASDTGQMFTPGDVMIDLQSAFNQNAVILFSFDYQSQQDTAEITSALVMADVKNLASKLQANFNERPWLFGIDEFTKAGSDLIMPMVQQVRESKARVLFSTQGIADIIGAGNASSLVGGEAYMNTILGQAETVICHRADSNTAEWFENQTGERWETVKVLTQTATRSNITDADQGAQSGHGSLNYNKVAPVQAKEIINLSNGETVMLGTFPIVPENRSRFFGLMKPKNKTVWVNYVQMVRTQVAIAAEEDAKALVKAGRQPEHRADWFYASHATAASSAVQRLQREAPTVPLPVDSLVPGGSVGEREPIEPPRFAPVPGSGSVAVPSAPASSGTDSAGGASGAQGSRPYGVQDAISVQKRPTSAPVPDQWDDVNGHFGADKGDSGSSSYFF